MRVLDSLLRLLGRLRLWQQFVLLGLFAVTIPIFVSTSRFQRDGQKILTDHEIIDLSDESNLRVTEFREEFEYLARDLGTVATEVARDPRDFRPAAEIAAAKFAYDWPASIPASGAEVTSVAQVRRRYFAGAFRYAIVLTPVGSRYEGTAIGGDGKKVALAAADATAKAAAEDAADRARRPSPTYVSGLHLGPPTGDAAPRCLVAVARVARWDANKPVGLIAVVFDFTTIIENRARTSPRHRYVVTDATGTLLVHSDAVAVREKKSVKDLGWTIPDYAWPAGNESADDRNRRLARVLRDGGIRLPGVKIPALHAFYRKGQFGIDLATALSERTADEVGKLNALLANEANADPQLRYGEVFAVSAYIELAHPDKAKLDGVGKKISAWWDAARGPTGSAVDWVEPLDCKEFQGQLIPLRLDTNDDDEPPRLIVSAALEELRDDIKTKFDDIVLWRVLPTVGIAALLTTLVVVVLTRSLRRLASTADSLADPKSQPNVLGGGCLEVNQLAKSLRTMATRLRDDAARFQTILRAAGEGIVVASGDGIIEEANRAAAKMFGFDKPEDLIRRKVSDLIADPLPHAGPGYKGDDPITSASMPSRGSPFFDAVRGRRKGGGEFWLEVTLRPVALRDRQVVTCVFRDVTDRKAHEEQIRSMNEDLERRVKVRTAELTETSTKLEVALKAAEAAIMAKDTFVANMSHELRQPLHIIIGFTEAIREEAEDVGDTKLVPDLNKVLAAAKHLLDLINDILDLAKISSGRLELSPSQFDVSRLVADVRTLVAPLADKNGNKFVVDAPADLGQMTADERRARQVLINLLSNSFKFTSKGAVTLRVRRVMEGKQEWMQFAVSDTGKGMSAEQVARLFQRFYQADPSTTREQSGTGLGLAITQSFNELMGGQPIRVTSAPGMGSEFVVRLPAGPRAPSVVALPPVPPPSPKNARASGRLVMPTPDPSGPKDAPLTTATVLVIDDDPMVLELMTRFLAKEGFRTKTATNATDGLRLAKEVKPTVITLDVMMPGANDGWQVLTTLKADPETCDIPVIMLTIVDDRGRGFALGAADYLTKPIDWPRLGAILHMYLPVDRTKPILVIDDEPECREVLRRHLEKEGWRVIEAPDGESGLRAVAADPPALVLLDLMMPGVDGFGFLEAFPKRFPGSRTPIVVLTAKDLAATDFDRLNGRVARILGKGDLAHLDHLIDMIRRHAQAAK